MYPTDEANPNVFMVCECVKCFSIFAVDAEVTGNHGPARVTLLNGLDQLILCVLREKKMHWFGNREL